MSQTRNETPETPEYKTIIPVSTPLYQANGGQIYQLNVETQASQVKMSDGNDAETRINTLERALSANTTTHVVDTIEERDALRNLIFGDTVKVLDATADETVEKGGATYLVMKDMTFRKTAEDESMDMVFSWEKIENRPQSGPDEIDMAAARQHTHGNKTTLDLISEDSEEGSPGTGCLLFNGRKIWDGMRDVVSVSVGGEIPPNLREGGLIVINPAIAAD